MKTYYGDREECYKCYRPKSSCMCEHFEHIDTQTKFIVLMHPKEFKKVKNNTGHFTHQILNNSELFMGIDFSQHKRINEIIATHESYILFPSVNAVNLTQASPEKSDKPLAIFLIDSTWACTRKMFTQSTNLNTLKHMSFSSDKTSLYQIKEQPKENYLSTIESTLVVLELLNGWSIENNAQSELDGFLRPFHKMIEYQKKLIESSISQSVRFKRHGIK
ncbi:tRNA-uridine aminocarboxypropyltransferase [Sulfurimonas sp.]|jgi:DTW domain-containing protein YfiP|uniref:tRNA-uridine aminocarboxypropyltransferase n=1 Tax=Sulfurimonas sp. TaxID=2022749 RepID=UPI0025F152F8|nr:tRNA-uridine aminocarboxypropyltransferase [Sulfurimonas sp.]MBT5935446.1 DTW domain-containing protein [Sulfurimonas sp.]